jgi:hypothetical protein
MTFNPKFTSYRSRLVGFALASGLYGALVLFLGHNPHRGKDALVIAAILALSAIIPESPGKKPEPEKYHITSP